mmetsp:Transcript_73789/g.202735  ORF Transcript_73789/g.202735 Transcript_73789/m.202735 type:complete len:209 (-) Transcript_73789:44-670(-)
MRPRLWRCTTSEWWHRNNHRGKHHRQLFRSIRWWDRRSRWPLDDSQRLPDCQLELFRGGWRGFCRRRRTDHHRQPRGTSPHDIECVLSSPWRRAAPPERDRHRHANLELECADHHQRASRHGRSRAAAAGDVHRVQAARMRWHPLRSVRCGGGRPSVHCCHAAPRVQYRGPGIGCFVRRARAKALRRTVPRFAGAGVGCLQLGDARRV